jgi:hypothetical protein
MEAPTTDSTRTPSTRPGPRRNRSAQKRKPRAAAEGAPPNAAEPFVLLDSERIADIQEEAGRKIRTLLRDKPYVALGGAFASGFILGGGFRTRLGRFLLLAAGRYVLVQAAERYLVT